jgi:hypothetical protein
MQPGKGYQIFLKGSADVSHVFPKAAYRSGQHGTLKSRAHSIQGEHFKVIRTGKPYHIVLDISEMKDRFQTGDEIGIFDGDLLVGSAVVSHGDILDIVSWEQDTDLDLPGFIKGNTMRIVHWSKETGSEEHLDVEFLNGDGTFGLAGYTAALISRSSTVSEYRRSQNYPNPFNPETQIRYEVPDGNFVRIEIFTIAGQMVRTLVNEYKSKGNYSVMWDGKDDSGNVVASGVYLYRMSSGNFSDVKKMLFLK